MSLNIMLVYLNTSSNMFLFVFIGIFTYMCVKISYKCILSFSVAVMWHLIGKHMNDAE